jgi:hypothetical protein
MPKLLGYRLSGIIPVSKIVALPSIVTFLKENLPSTSQISVLGERGGIYANTNITQYCTFEKTNGKSSINVNSTGLISCSSFARIGDSADITITYYYPTCGIVTDYITINVEGVGIKE